MALNDRHEGWQRLDRRQFVSAAAAAVLAPALVRGDAANSKIRLGLIGCGSRGGGMLAALFEKHGGFKLVACADYFQDRVDAVGEKFSVTGEKRYTGLNCYRNLIQHGEVDAVAIISPPYFHPEQAGAAVAAGKHVYLAKPVSVDVPGCHAVAQHGKTATDKKLVFLVDFQTRANPFFLEALQRVHQGAIGSMAFGESFYHAEALGEKEPPAADIENRLRNWVFDKQLSGDIITEQNIHTLDVMTWIMDKPPLHVQGTGGRKVRTHVGDCWDYFTLVYDFGDGVGVTFSSRQFKGHGTQPSGIINRMFGDQGVLETKYGGEVMIRGRNFYRGGSTQTIYRDGVVANIATFHDSIKQGKCDNPTVAPSVRSNLVTLLGRTAAYENRRVTWDELIQSDKKTAADLTGLKS